MEIMNLREQSVGLLTWKRRFGLCKSKESFFWQVGRDDYLVVGYEFVSWWKQEYYSLSPEETADWELFKELLKKRFIPPVYYDGSKQEFAKVKQGRWRQMSIIESF